MYFFPVHKGLENHYLLIHSNAYLKEEKNCLKVCIFNKWNWMEKNPVIHIWWDNLLNSMEAIKEKLYLNLLDNHERLKVNCEQGLSPSGCFERLIKKHMKNTRSQ